MNNNRIATLKRDKPTYACRVTFVPLDENTVRLHTVWNDTGVLPDAGCATRDVHSAYAQAYWDSLLACGFEFSAI